ncbi:hypothetical protein J6590_082686 [Homalodisca vitripennis]|nr:hypothetical protein J6590_082686 [Homalodisca vitripennis]
MPVCSQDNRHADNSVSQQANAWNIDTFPKGKPPSTQQLKSVRAVRGQHQIRRLTQGETSLVAAFSGISGPGQDNRDLRYCRSATYIRFRRYRRPSPFNVFSPSNS